MKITTLLLFVMIMQVSASSYGQKINLNVQNVSIENALKSIEKQSGYVFFYDNNVIPKVNIKLNLNNATVEEALKASIKDQSINYEIVKNNIFLTKREPTIIQRLSLVFTSTTIDVNGVVKDEKGNPLAGATIKMNNSPRLVFTNVNGEFVFRNVDPKAVFTVSYIGYSPKEFTAKKDVIISLAASDSHLDSVSIVVSTGYQTLNKERVTGSFVQISNEQLNRKVGGNILDRIFEITSGLEKVNKPEGFQVRGISTLNANKSVLIVLDDFPFTGDINRLNPNDIESVTVLKDAAAASIWGARAGNGVIVMTTKKGKFNRRPQISFNSNVTVSDKPNLFYNKIISTQEEIDFERMRFNRGDYNAYDDTYPGRKAFTNILPEVPELLLAVRRGELSQTDADAKIAALQGHDVRKDVNKYFLQNAIQQQYALNLNGGVENYNYYASVGYDKNRSDNIGAKNDRVSLLFNNTYKPVKGLELNAFVGFNQTTSNTPNVYSNNLLPGSNIATYTRLVDDNGNALAIPRGVRMAYADTVKAPGMLDWHYRPLDELKYADNLLKNYDIRVGGSAKYTIIPGLSAQLKYQYQKILSDTRNNKSVQTFDTRNSINTLLDYDPVSKTPIYPLPLGGIVSFANGDQTTTNVRGQLNYDKQFGDHEITAIAGSEYRQDLSNSRTSMLYGFNDDNYTSQLINPTKQYTDRFNRPASIADGRSVASGINRSGSYFTNASYTYLQKYTISGSARADLSNFFGIKANQRVAPLWSTGASWNLSKESFYKVDWLPYLKLRATYGFNGNTTGGNAYATARYNTSTITGITVPYASIVSPNNPDLRWEKVGITNLAVEAASKDSRISGSFEYYFKKSVDLIGPIDLDPTTGFYSFTGNGATTKGEGFDFVLNTRNLTGGLKWNTGLLLSRNTDKVISYNQVPTYQTYLAEQAPIIGRPFYKLYSYKWAGLDPVDGAPRFFMNGVPTRYDKSAQVKPEDLVYSGNLLPKYFGSLMNSFSYKDFSLSFNISFRFDYVFRRQSLSYESLYNGWSTHADYSKRWQKPGDELTTNVPALPAFGIRYDAYTNSDILVEKGDLIRLQDLRLDYSFNKSSYRLLPFQSIRVFLYANNLGLLWTANKKGLDPEYGNGGIPVARSISAGLNINF